MRGIIMIDCITIQTKVNDFIRYLRLERHHSIHTQQAYHADLQQFISFWQGLSTSEKANLTLRQIVERYLLSLFHQGLNKSSIARKFSCFASFEKFLKNEGIILDLQLARPQLDKKEPVYLSVDEIFFLLDKIKDHELPTRQPSRDKAIFELMYASGIRCSEIVCISIGDIDLLNKTIVIKGNRERIVLFGQKAKERILAYLASERPEMQSIDEPLFLNHSKSQLTSRSIQRIIAMFRIFLHTKHPITPHQLRHSFAAHLLSQGVSLHVVKELLGHKTIASTEQYTSIVLDKKRSISNPSSPQPRSSEKGTQHHE